MKKFVTSVVAIIVVIVLLLSFLFRIQLIEVEGQSRYTAQQFRQWIIPKSWEQNSLFLWYKCKGHRYPDIPYVAAVDAELVSNRHVMLHVTEKRLILQQAYDEGYVDVSDDGIVQGVSPGRDHDTLLVEGMEPLGRGYGAKISDIDPKKEAILLTLGKQIKRWPTLPFQTVVISDDTYVLKNEQLRVNLGKGEDMALKLEELSRMYEQVSDRSGILHLEHYQRGDEGYRFEENFS